MKSFKNQLDMILKNSVFEINAAGKCPFMDSFEVLANQDFRLGKALRFLEIKEKMDAQNGRYQKIRMKLFEKTRGA